MSRYPRQLTRAERETIYTDHVYRTRGGRSIRLTVATRDHGDGTLTTEGVYLTGPDLRSRWAHRAFRLSPQCADMSRAIILASEML